jgi:drug/metabolite transporter (DMT)-like permease
LLVASVLANSIMADPKGTVMDIKAIGMGLAFALMWSSAFTSARVIVEYAPPLSALALRFLISGLLGVLIAWLLGQSARLSRRQWLGVMIFGICQNALYLGLNFVAMQTIPASLAAIIASTMPLLVALAGWLIFGNRVRPLGIAGLIAGVIGVVLIMGARLQGGVDVYGLILCVIGVVSLTIATLAVLGASSGGNVLMIVGLQMLVGSVILWVPALTFEVWDVTWNWQLVVAFVYTTLVPGLAATLVWFLLVGRIGAVKASTFHFLNPFLGVAIAAALLGEAIGVLDVIGVAIIAGGILAVQLSKQ